MTFAMQIPSIASWVEALVSERRTHPLYKPALLLVAIDMIDEGLASPASIPFSAELERRFGDLLARAGEPGRESEAWQPFFHLATQSTPAADPIWELRRGITKVQADKATRPSSKDGLRALADSAALRPDLGVVLENPIGRTGVVNLIYRWLETRGERGLSVVRAHDRDWPLVERAAGMVRDSLQSPFQLFREYTQVTISEVARRARDRALRLEVLPSYDHACALCGVRIRWFDYVEACAAHIVPVEENGSDDVRNALSLCHTHHWAFDLGVWSVAEDLAILVIDPPADAESQGVVDVAALRPFAGRTLRRPTDPTRVPHHDALAWHRRWRFERLRGLAA